MYELTLIETALRGVAARLAAERATDAEATRITEACDQAEGLTDEAVAAGADWSEPRIRDILQVTRRFHHLIDEAAHTATLTDMISTATAFDWAFRLRWSADSHPDLDSLHASLQQHREVATAISARDGQTAEEAMRRHTASRARAYLAIAAREASRAPAQP
jgi:DNA-binding GntR family transcriptional regulator